MLTVISPAKTLDQESELPTAEFSQPSLLKESRKLVKQLREYSADDLSRLMNISDTIADLNQKRFKQWKTPFKPENARPALFTFMGDVYIGLDAFSMNRQNISFAQDHLRILSGLYGVLKPLDLMQAYRLEMGTKLATDRAANLYQFWGSQITDTLNDELGDTDTLVNLASNEYFKSVKPKELHAEVITPAFKDFKNGDYKMIGFFAKKARGHMARYIIDNEIDDAEGIKAFDIDGYRFNSKLSKNNNWVFTRKQ